MTPRLLTTKAEVRREIDVARKAGARVGLVPTMGYLHEGHLSLARRARTENDLVVVSIFVNPTQFGPNEDFGRYPRDLDRDLALAAETGVDLVFHPAPDEMCSAAHATWVEVEGLTERLCGASRPGHFRGVATIVAKLLSICRPDRAYFGQKDAQQALMVRRLVEDLDLGAEVVICPIVREKDGLALSSRNLYLSAAERAQAPILHRALLYAEGLVAAGERDAHRLVEAVRARITQASLGRVEYVEVVGMADLEPLSVLEGEFLVALAVWFGKTRLIDNAVFHLPPPSSTTSSPT